MEELITKITGIVFSNRQTGFHVLKTTSDGNGSSITVRGSFPGIPISVGLKAKFSGRFDNHPTYGRQLNASVCEILPEKGRNGVMTYLSNHVPSIGPVTAAKLYDALGEELLKILDSDPEQIRSLSFLTKRQADAIINEWAEASDIRNSSIYLSNLGLSTLQIRNVYTKYGSKTREIINNNPYLLYGCNGVGFATADAAARRLGVGVDDMKRVRAMVLFAITELSQFEGHVYVTSSQILDLISKRLFKKHSIESFTHGEYMSESHFFSALTELQATNDVMSVDNRIYLASHWVHENEAALCLAKMIRQDPQKLGDLDFVLSSFEEKLKIQLSAEQKDAFLLLNRSRVIAITGYPGTGKTTLISAFVHLFEELNLHYALLSPTGIAAKRLSQVTGKTASTIHRALGYSKDGTWEFNANNKYVADAVIVDEMSMVDAATFHHLITSVPSSTIMIMVGDSAQLPSVGAGFVLNNLMNCPDLPHVALTKIYRQGKTSDIITVAHSILNGEPVDTGFNRESEFMFINYPKDQVVYEICKLATSLKNKTKNFQVIAPMYDGELGVNNLNQELRDILNPGCFDKKANFIKSGDSELYEGDRIMVIKNDYDRMVYNGDVGKIQRISIKNDEIEVKIFDWFDQESTTIKYVDKTMTFKIEEAKAMLRVAYACTAHKVQGQEFDYIIMPMTSQYGVMLYKNLIYTAITRAKKKVFMLGDPRSFAYAIQNERETTRNSYLKELIHEYSDTEAVRQVQEA